MSVVSPRFFSAFAGDAFDRERNNATPVFRRPQPGTAHCEGCAMPKPIKGVSRKGWRCDDCKAARKTAQKTA